MKFTASTAIFALLAVATAFPHGLVTRQNTLTGQESNPVMKKQGGGKENIIPFSNNAKRSEEGLFARQNTLTGQESNPVMKKQGGGKENIIPYTNNAKRSEEGLATRQNTLTGQESNPVMKKQGGGKENIIPYTNNAKRSDLKIRKSGSTSAPVMARNGVVMPFSKEH